jgi:hypothetical protein
MDGCKTIKHANKNTVYALKEMFKKEKQRNESMKVMKKSQSQKYIKPMKQSIDKRLMYF